MKVLHGIALVTVLTLTVQSQDTCNVTKYCIENHCALMKCDDQEYSQTMPANTSSCAILCAEGFHFPGPYLSLASCDKGEIITKPDPPCIPDQTPATAPAPAPSPTPHSCLINCTSTKDKGCASIECPELKDGKEHPPVEDGTKCKMACSDGGETKNVTCVNGEFILDQGQGGCGGGGDGRGTAAAHGSLTCVFLVTAFAGILAYVF